VRLPPTEVRAPIVASDTGSGWSADALASAIAASAGRPRTGPPSPRPCRLASTVTSDRSCAASCWLSITNAKACPAKAGVTVRRLAVQLRGIGIDVSRRQVMRLLIAGQDGFMTEARDVLRAGLANAAWVTDSAGLRVTLDAVRSVPGRSGLGTRGAAGTQSGGLFCLDRYGW
jgi:hypothetical protein